MMADFDILVADDVLQSAVFSNPCFLHNHAVFNGRSFSYVNSSEQDRIFNLAFDDAAVSDNRLLYPAVFSVFYWRIVFYFCVDRLAHMKDLLPKHRLDEVQTMKKVAFRRVDHGGIPRMLIAVDG